MGSVTFEHISEDDPRYDDLFTIWWPQKPWSILECYIIWTLTSNLTNRIADSDREFLFKWVEKLKDK